MCVAQSCVWPSGGAGGGQTRRRDEATRRGNETTPHLHPHHRRRDRRIDVNVVVVWTHDVRLGAREESPQEREPPRARGPKSEKGPETPPRRCLHRMHARVRSFLRQQRDGRAVGASGCVGASVQAQEGAPRRPKAPEGRRLKERKAPDPPLAASTAAATYSCNCKIGRRGAPGSPGSPRRFATSPGRGA